MITLFNSKTIEKLFDSDGTWPVGFVTLLIQYHFFLNTAFPSFTNTKTNARGKATVTASNPHLKGKIIEGRIYLYKMSLFFMYFFLEKAFRFLNILLSWCLIVKDTAFRKTLLSLAIFFPFLVDLSFLKTLKGVFYEMRAPYLLTLPPV